MGFLYDRESPKREILNDIEVNEQTVITVGS